MLHYLDACIDLLRAFFIFFPALCALCISVYLARAQAVQATRPPVREPPPPHNRERRNRPQTLSVLVRGSRPTVVAIIALMVVVIMALTKEVATALTAAVPTTALTSAECRRQQAALR